MGFAGSKSKKLIMKVVSKNFANRGADISFLSAFKSEAEVLYPPLTYLTYVGEHTETIEGEEVTFVSRPWTSPQLDSDLAAVLATTSHFRTLRFPPETFRMAHAGRRSQLTIEFVC